MRVRFGVFVALGALFVGTAHAKAAMPRPLERIVADADLVVVAKLVTKPAHPGDPFDVDVEEALKGKPEAGPLHVKAAHFFMGCEPMPAGTPAPKSIESEADRAVLFLDAPTDGARQSRDPILLRRGGCATAFYGSGRSASLAPDAIRALVATHAPALSDETAATLWETGLRSDNALLVECLLVRVLLADRSKEGAVQCLGNDVGGRAVAAWKAARRKLLAVTADLAASPDDGVAQRALEAMLVVRETRAPAEAPHFARAVAAAATMRKRESAELRAIATRVLVAESDPAAADFVVDAFANPQFRAWDLPPYVEAAGALLERRDARSAELVAALVKALDDPESVPRVSYELGRATGEKFTTADEWRAWLRARQAAK